MNTHIFTQTIEYALAAFKQHVLGETRTAYNGITFPPVLIEQAFQKFQSTFSPDMKLRFNGRLERGLQIAMTGGVMPDKDLGKLNGYFKVRSSNPNNPPYLVDLHQRSCTCPDHWKGHFCKHRIAANIINVASTLNKAETPAPIQPQSELPAKPAPAAHLDNDKIALPKQMDDAVIWGVVTLEGAVLGVEVLDIKDDSVVVRALPRIIDGKKLQPQFPFPGKLCMMKVRKEELSHVTVFR